MPSTPLATTEFKRCSRCHRRKRHEHFHRCASKHDGLQANCKACNVTILQRRYRGPMAMASDAIDRFPHRCLHRFLTSKPCKRRATHRGNRDSEWRSCDLHRLPTDKPIHEHRPQQEVDPRHDSRP